MHGNDAAAIAYGQDKLEDPMETLLNKNPIHPEPSSDLDLPENPLADLLPDNPPADLDLTAVGLSDNKETPLVRTILRRT
jgi:hypothetical protein